MAFLFSPIRVCTVTLLLAQALMSTSVLAAGFQINEISPSLQGDATAGAAAANNDVSALFINPATLTTLKHNQAYLGGSEILPDIRVSNARAIHTVTVPGQPESFISAPVVGVTSQPSISKSAFIPDGYIGWRLNDKFIVGLALVAPFGLTTKYYADSVLRFDGIYSSVKTLNLTPSMAYAINDKWAVGAGFQAQYIKATFSNFNGPYTSLGPIDRFIAATNPTYLNGDSWGYGYTFGVLFKPDLCTRLGLGFRSKIVERLTGDGEQYTAPGGTVPAPSQDFLFNAQTAVDANIKTPAVLTLSAARDIVNWTMKASIQMNFWNSFKHLSINMPEAFATNSTLQTRWRNTWLAAVGADYQAAPHVILRGGVAFDENPTRNQYRDVRIPDSNRIWLNVGASYLVNPHWSFDGAYSHIFIHDQAVNVVQASGSSATSVGPLEINQVHANYKGAADVVALALRYSFC